jgi:D-cysteine desulfhydrase/L-cysteate sulfo-lyase
MPDAELLTSLRLGRLNELPRAKLGHTPTPLDPMPRLAQRLGIRHAWVKRDDCTGLAFGGNKVRQLEFYLGQAQAEDADTILITGAVQSNFVRLAAAAASQLGMECHIQLEERVPKSDPVYRNSGNVLLDKILGATLYSYPDGEDEEGADRRLHEIASGLKEKGRHPYVIPLGPGHKPLGALGYVVAAAELLAQLEDQKVKVDEIFVPSGSGATHAGLLTGLRALDCSIPVAGVCVRRNATAQTERISGQCLEIAKLIDIPPVVIEDDVRLTDDFLAPGYGQLGAAAVEAITLSARTEGLILDPVYSAKTMAGFIHGARSSGPQQSLLFVHTGGTPAVFAYASELADNANKHPNSD